MLKRLTLISLVIAALPLTAASRSTHPDNEVADFERSGAWEIWCIKQGDTGKVICDLNLVIIYKYHPDFRAMIPRVYYTPKQGYMIEFEYEFQTSFSDGYLLADDGQRFDLSGCDRPCIFEGAQAAEFVSFLRNSQSMRVVFDDYLVQEFDIEFDLNGFDQGVDTLEKMQSDYPM